MQFQNLVEQFVRRKTVLIGLVRAQFGGGRFVKNRQRDIRRAAVSPARNPIDHHLGQIRDDGQAAVHIAIERAVAHSHFRFIAGGQQQRAELIGKRHQQIAADAGLDILFRHVRLAYPRKASCSASS